MFEMKSVKKVQGKGFELLELKSVKISAVKINIYHMKT